MRDTCAVAGGRRATAESKRAVTPVNGFGSMRQLPLINERQALHTWYEHHNKASAPVFKISRLTTTTNTQRTKPEP